MPRHVNSPGNLVYGLGGESLTLGSIAVRSVTILLTAFRPLLLGQGKGYTGGQQDDETRKTSHFKAAEVVTTDFVLEWRYYRSKREFGYYIISNHNNN